MANRRSARESRDRRKKQLAGLQVAVKKLAQENEQITESNRSMKRELVSLLQEATRTMDSSLSSQCETLKRHVEDICTSKM